MTGLAAAVTGFLARMAAIHLRLLDPCPRPLQARLHPQEHRPASRLLALLLALLMFMIFHLPRL
jgi:hypothetical protein